MKYFTVTNRGLKYGIPCHVIATDYANYYLEKYGENFDLNFNMVMDNSEICKDHAENNMNLWKDQYLGYWRVLAVEKSMTLGEKLHDMLSDEDSKIRVENHEV